MSYTVIGKDTCSFTRRVKNLLSAHDIEFVYYEKDDDAAREWAELKTNGHKKVPWVFDETRTFIGGFVETKDHLLR